jgi:CNT family concentrative nucleoside transporter
LVYSFENARSLLAIVAIIFIAWLLSENKKRFPVMMVLGALALQAGLVLLLFAVPATRGALSSIGYVISGLADATSHGAQFVFGFLAGGPQPYAIAEGQQAPFIFGFRVLPVILVICTLAAVLWHWGILRIITEFFGRVFSRVLGLSGQLAFAVSANIFMGMIESAMVVRAYLSKLTRAELFTLMCVGLANVSGSTMVAYVLILGDVLPNAAGHVLVASIISAPAGVLLAQVMIPEEPGRIKSQDYSSDLKYSGTMDAIARGVHDGTMVVVNVAAFLIAFVSLVWIVNNMLAFAPPIAGEPVTLQSLFGYAFAPVAYAIGIPWADAQEAGRILGTKLFLTEFVAFIDLGAIPRGEIADRSRMILTYAVCGFANVASIGILSGGFTALMPERRDEILSLAWRALLPGFMATLMTASVVAALPAGVFGASP